jgi:hypothetical protein
MWIQCVLLQAANTWQDLELVSALCCRKLYQPILKAVSLIASTVHHQTTTLTLIFVLGNSKIKIRSSFDILVVPPRDIEVEWRTRRILFPNSPFVPGAFFYVMHADFSRHSRVGIGRIFKMLKCLTVHDKWTKMFDVQAVSG